MTLSVLKEAQIMSLRLNRVHWKLWDMKQGIREQHRPAADRLLMA